MKVLQKSQLAKAMAAVTLSALLAACAGEDGKDGKDGTNGVNGQASSTVGLDGSNGANGVDGTDGTNGKDAMPAANTGTLTRLATVPAGAEVTGAYLTEEGDLFFNVQHPSSANTEADVNGKVFDKGTVGVLKGLDFNKLPKTLISSPVPITNQEKQTVVTAYGQYQVLAQTGETFGGAIPNGLGTVMDVNGTAAVKTINDPDFNGFISTAENEGYLFTNWEAVPGGMSRVKLSKTNTGWMVDNSDAMMIDFGQRGTIANCFGSVSPWNTPLTSEEWGSPGTKTYQWDDSRISISRRDDMVAFYATSATAPNKVPNTYGLHYIVEITEPTAAAPVAVKHFAMGRFEHENSIVMPDQKTVYLSQDDGDAALFKFVADTAADLSAGTLYAAKVTQDEGVDEPLITGFDVEWIELAHGTNAEIAPWIAEYDNVEFYGAGGSTSYLTTDDAQAWAAGDATFPTVANGGGKITAEKAMDNRVAFLESREAARAKGATVEFTKLEGIYINQKRAKEAVEGVDLVSGEVVESAYVYYAQSYLKSGMTDDQGDIQISNRVGNCGGVYRMKLEAGYDVSRIEPVVMGATYRTGVSSSEACDVNSIAQPDNVIVADDGRLIIGEDGKQPNNTLWIYNPEK